MPWTPKQHRFFEAVAHGMKPRNGSDLSQGKAKDLAAEGIQHKAFGGSMKLGSTFGRFGGGVKSPIPAPHRGGMHGAEHMGMGKLSTVPPMGEGGFMALGGEAGHSKLAQVLARGAGSVSMHGGGCAHFAHGGYSRDHHPACPMFTGGIEEGEDVEPR